MGILPLVNLTSTKNGASIYLPTAGYWNGRHITFKRENAYYWTSTLHESTQNNQHVFAYAGAFVENSVTPKCVTNYKRPWGMPVRPVIAKSDADVYSIAPAGAEAVDLGLSVLWANMNVGATAAEEWGNFYSWGETFTKNEYGWYYEYVTGKDAEGKDIAVTTNISNYKWGAYDTGFTGYTGATVLEPADDAATANWGSEWRMPTKEDFEELIAYTTYKKHQVNGVWGGLFTGSNGNTIFLLAGGYHNEESLNTVGSNGVYYSSTVNTNNCLTAYFMNITGTSCEINSYIRPRGYNVRAVKAE